MVYSPGDDESRDRRAEVGSRVVPELGDERVSLERRLNEAALNTAASPVHEAHLAQPGLGSGVYVVARRRQRHPAGRRRAGRSRLRWGCGWVHQACRSRHFLLGRASLARGRHHGLDAAPHRKIADHRHAAWVNHADEIVEDLIRHVFVKNASVSELDHVVA